MKAKTAPTPSAESSTLGAAIAKLREDEAAARIDIQRIADERDRLLDDDASTIEQFDGLNVREQTAAVAIKRAARALPRLEKSFAAAIAADQAAKAADYRAELLEAAGRIEEKLRGLIAENLAAQALFEQAARDLPVAKFQLETVVYRGAPTMDGLTAWLSYCAENIFPRRQRPASAPPPAPPAPVKIPAPVDGKHRLVILRPFNGFQPGDLASFKAKEAEDYVRRGAADFFDGDAP